MNKIKKSQSSARKNYQKLEEVVGCKWSVSVLQAIALGVKRPGALERYISGISTKILSERLRKLTKYNLLSKHVYAEIPPRTEYALTQNGKKLIDIIQQINELDGEIKTANEPRH